MPHLCVEYTKNLESEVDVTDVLRSLHLATLKCAGVDINRVKSRLVEHQIVLSGDQATATKMIHVSMAILSGRDAETRKAYGQQLFEVLENKCQQVERPLSLTVEIRELEKNCYFRN